MQCMQLWEDMRKKDLFPNSQMQTKVITGFLRHGTPADAMYTYEDIKKSPDPPEELPYVQDYLERTSSTSPFQKQSQARF